MKADDTVGEALGPILMYHAIGEAPAGQGDARSRGIFVAAGALRRQIELLTRLGYSGVSLREAIWGGAARRPRQIVLTFDDGYANFREAAWPLLQQHGFTATVYVVTSAIGGHAAWPFALPLLGAGDLRELAAEGVEIASHGQTHRDLRTLSPHEREAEIVDSKACLEDLLGKPVSTFAFPYGHDFPGAETVLHRAGYVAACSTKRDNRSRPQDRYALRRIMVSERTGGMRLRYQLSPLYRLECLWKRVRRRNSPFENGSVEAHDPGHDRLE